MGPSRRHGRACRRVAADERGRHRRHLSDLVLTLKNLATRIAGGGTPRPERWGVDSEYGTLRDVLVGPIDHFAWRAGNAVAERSERVGLKFDSGVARAQYAEMLDAYAQAGVAVHIL